MRKIMFEQHKQLIVSKQKKILHHFAFRCKCKRIVIKKKVRFLFGDKFDEEEYKRMKGHLKYIKQNRELVSIVYVIHVKQVQVPLHRYFMVFLHVKHFYYDSIVNQK